MNKEASLLLNKCAVLSREVSRVVAGYQSVIGHCPSVASQLSKTENRSKEYENGSFIVLVVGPVKSGKSTLVNLIANAYVSPTHFLECTVRPSVISQRREGEPCCITVFASEASSNHAEQVDAIIDCIRGIGTEEELTGISKTVVELTPENVRDKVELRLNDDLASDTLLTSITTPGGKLMRQNVFIIDMPGFDGENANIDNPVYDAISQRADLILFVQSSNSAISKVSWQFLRMLSDNNRDVPVCLIHNVFDSSWWRTEEERMSAVSKQKEIAIREIRKQGFTIDDGQCFCINLGKVEDGRKAAYHDTPSLRSEVEQYERMEDILYERVISCRDAMRLRVCLGRTRQQVEKSLAAVDEELAKHARIADKYQKADDEFAKTDVGQVFLASRQPLTADFDALNQAIRSEAKSRIMLVDTDNNHKSNGEALRIVRSFIEDCERSLSATFRKNLSLEQKEEELYLECRKRVGQVMETVIQCGAHPLQSDIRRLSVGEVPAISLSPGVDLDLLISRKPVFPLLVTRLGGHSAEDVVGYINKAAECLAGSQSGDASRMTGYVEKEGGAIRPVIDRVNQRLEALAAEYEELCRQYWQQNREAVLGSIIADKNAFDAECGRLNELRQELFKIKEQL